METTVIPSDPITEGQIGKLNEKFNAQVRKHKSELSSELVQKILEDPDDTLISEMFALLRKRVDAISNLIMRTVTVNRKRSAKEALDATGRKQYTDTGVVKKMPNGTGEETEVFFFNLVRYVNDSDLDKEYELRGLKPADPYSLSAVNEADPAFADTHPNSTHWKDENDKWCFATFFRHGDERYLDVYRDDSDWDGGWWFAGVRK